MTGHTGWEADGVPAPCQGLSICLYLPHFTNPEKGRHKYRAKRLGE